MDKNKVRIPIKNIIDYLSNSSIFHIFGIIIIFFMIFFKSKTPNIPSQNFKSLPWRAIFALKCFYFIAALQMVFIGLLIRILFNWYMLETQSFPPAQCIFMIRILNILIFLYPITISGKSLNLHGKFFFIFC